MYHYGDILDVKIANETTRVLLVNNYTGGIGLECLLLDLSSFEIIFDFIDMKEFESNENIDVIRFVKNLKDVEI